MQFMLPAARGMGQIPGWGIKIPIGSMELKKQTKAHPSILFAPESAFEEDDN